MSRFLPPFFSFYTKILSQSILLCLIMVSFFPLRSFAQEECRLKKENIKPLIERFNPYFSNHTYKASKYTELARMGKYRLLVVKQSGCKRHHINFNLLLDSDVVMDEPDFWIAEAKSMLHKVFHQDPNYKRLGPEFDRLFEEKFRMYGLGRKFNFPIGTRNFICQIINDPENGGQIAIEMVSYIFKERVDVKRKGVSLKDDDGWKASDGNP